MAGLLTFDPRVLGSSPRLPTLRHARRPAGMFSSVDLAVVGVISAGLGVERVLRPGGVPFRWGLLWLVCPRRRGRGGWFETLAQTSAVAGDVVLLMFERVRECGDESGRFGLGSRSELGPGEAAMWCRNEDLDTLAVTVKRSHSEARSVAADGRNLTLRRTAWQAAVLAGRGHNRAAFCDTLTGCVPL